MEIGKTKCLGGNNQKPPFIFYLADNLYYCNFRYVSNIFLIFTNRSWIKNIITSFKIPNKSLVWIVSLIAVFLTLAVFVPYLRKVFYFDFLSLFDIAISLGAGILSVVWFEIAKSVYVRKGEELSGEQGERMTNFQ